LAIVETDIQEAERVPWVIPMNTRNLARITWGEEDHGLREQQSLFTARLTGLPGDASEVLVLRCLRNKGAKAVYIPPNRNGNQRRSATVAFATERDLNAAQTKPIRFGNHVLSWKNPKNKNDYKDRRSIEQKSIKEEAFEEMSIWEECESVKSRENTRQKKKKSNNEKKPNITWEDDMQAQLASILQTIMERLENLETQQVQTAIQPGSDYPNRF